MKNKILIPVILILLGVAISFLAYYAPDKTSWFDKLMTILAYSFSVFLALGGIISILFSLQGNNKSYYSEIKRKELNTLKNKTSKKDVFIVALKKTLSLFLPLLAVLVIFYIVKGINTNILLTYIFLFIIHLIFRYIFYNHKCTENKS